MEIMNYCFSLIGTAQQWPAFSHLHLLTKKEWVKNYCFLLKWWPEKLSMLNLLVKFKFCPLIFLMYKLAWQKSWNHKIEYWIFWPNSNQTLPKAAFYIGSKIHEHARKLQIKLVLFYGINCMRMRWRHLKQRDKNSMGLQKFVIDSESKKMPLNLLFKYVAKGKYWEWAAAVHMLHET